MLLAAAALLSACQLRLDLRIEVDRNGAGTLDVALAADDELLREARDRGVDPLRDLVSVGRALDDEGWTVQREDVVGEGRTVTFSTSFADGEELRALTADLADALNAPEMNILEPFTVVVEPDRLTVAGGASLEPTALVAEHGLRRAQAVRLLRRTDAIAYDIRVALPGTVLETTGERTGAGALVWTIRPGESVDVYAAGTRPMARWPLVDAAAAAVALLLVALLWWRRREHP